MKLIAPSVALALSLALTAPAAGQPETSPPPEAPASEPTPPGDQEIDALRAESRCAPGGPLPPPDFRQEE